LNDDFEGGSTDFTHDTVAPERGAGLFFHHPHLHRGAPVTAGRKYVLRTDIMYRS
jgi:prolyl 4-hydroxylase